jgi:hypothetical protein
MKGEKEMNLRKMFQKSERGQALAEYVVLLPPMLLVSFMVLIPVASRANYIFCSMVYVMDPSVGQCDQWLNNPVEEEEEVVVAGEDEEECVVLQEESGGSQCDQHDDCDHLPGLNVGSYEASEDIDAFVIKAGKDYHVFESGLTEDGCYYVEIIGNQVSWERYGGGKDCKDVSHEQVWKTPLCK